nr:polygalacturonase QRT2-like [Ipomoea batatas]
MSTTVPSMGQQTELGSRHGSDVVYQNISGTASRETAINLNCSRSVACTGIRMESIDITAQAASGTVAAYCSNARGQESVVEPGPCLQQL